MKVHFIAVGGSAMHNLAIALHKKGYEVTGSDDEVFEPSKSRLEKYGLLPREMGWSADRITSDIEAVILGMHARSENPELLRAQELNLKIYSYPEYIYEQTKEKIRVVIGGSHGKTSITAMILYVLNSLGRDVDYMVGAQLEGFDTMVKLTEEASIVILEGDEYLSSPIDRRPKFLLYKPHIALVSGIAWDHINVFPTFDKYIEQFKLFMESVPDSGTIVYCEVDSEVKRLTEGLSTKASLVPYGTPAHIIRSGKTYLVTESQEVPLEVFGAHNLQNLNGARQVLNQLSISDEKFYNAIQGFSGASKRLELVAENNQSVVYKDFAHSPSKLKATTMAVKLQYPNRKLVACMELHTFSSLNTQFLEEYGGSMKAADTAIVYFNAHTLEHKNLPSISKEDVKAAFDDEDLIVLTDSNQLQNLLKGIEWHDQNLLLMSSGNFDGMNLDEFGNALLNK